MTKLITLEKAKVEIERLQDYVYLVESYETDTLEKQIIKEYAITNSIPKVTKNLGVDYVKVVEVLNSRGRDDLHKLVRSGYMHKTKSSRSK